MPCGASVAVAVDLGTSDYLIENLCVHVWETAFAGWRVSHDRITGAWSRALCAVKSVDHVTSNRPLRWGSSVYSDAG